MQLRKAVWLKAVWVSLRETAWLKAAWIFGGSRLAIIFITIMALRTPLAGQTTTRDCADSSFCFLSTWYHWDVLAYVGLAQHGYSSLPDTVFFHSGPY